MNTTTSWEAISFWMVVLASVIEESLVSVSVI
jgi:hypothetical protein